jgi:hypothetical protein
MPLPLIPIILGGAAAALGIGKGIKAAVDNNEANNVNSDANEIIDSAKDYLKLCRKKSGKALEVLGSKKLFVLNNSIARFIISFGKIKNVRLRNSVGLDELGEFILDKQSFESLREMEGYASSILGGVAGGAAGGALAAFGAYSGVMAFGAASTGTAIATLSGVAATNATLAFLGGGSLAAGGLGIASGAAVLGGLVAGPALAIMGFVMGAKASKNLDNAYSNLAEAKKMAEELKTASVLCNGIYRRACMFERLLIRLDAVFLPLIFELEEIVNKPRKTGFFKRLFAKFRKNTIDTKNVDWNSLDPAEQKTVAAVASIAKAIKTVIDTPILTEDGKITGESEIIARDVKLLVDKTEKQAV